MSLKDVSLHVSECLTGACGEMSRAEMVNTISSDLVDIVFEYLASDGITFEDQHTYRLIETLVASAMIAQAEYDMRDMNMVLGDLHKLQRDSRTPPEKFDPASA